MAISNNLNNREFDKFKETQGGETAVRVIEASGLLSGVVFDAVSVSYPTNTTEVYTFKTGGVSGITVATITLTYTNVSKQNLSSVVKT